MSNGVFGSGSSSSSSSSARVLIPNTVRKTIHDIREITGKQHSDEEIYAVLRECSMDPNETIQKLMYLDTFHEVKGRRERRKENFNGKPSEERPSVGMMRKGFRGGHGNYASNFSSDVGGGRNAGRRENGAMPFSHRARNYAQSRAARVSSTALPNGTATLANGHGPRLSADSEVGKMGSADSEPAVGVTSSPTLGSSGTEQAKSDEIPTPFGLLVSDVNSSSESLSAPSILGRYCGGVSEMGNEVGTQQLVAETNPVNDSEVVYDDNDSFDQTESDEAVHEDINYVEREDCPSKPSTPEIAPGEVNVPEVAAITAEISSLSISESNFSNGQHVTFPNHFQVPDALKTGLTFGSFDVTFGPTADSVNVSAKNRDIENIPQDSVEAAKHPTPCEQKASSVVEGGNLDNLQSATHSAIKLQPSKDEQPKQETQFLPDCHQNHIINMPAGYLGLMSPMIAGPLMSYDGLDTQSHESHIPIYANGNALVPPSTNPSPPLPSSIAASPQSVPVFRQAYTPSFYPYGQYISPYYIPQMHHYLGHNGFAPQAATGNMYLPQAAPSAGVKFSVPQFKPGNTAGNPAHIGIQPAGSYISTPVGYPQPVTSGSSMGNDELMATHLKDSQIYTTGHLQSEGTGVWVHAGAGQEMPTMHMSSLYNLAPQPHIAYQPQQPGHGGAAAYAAVFPPPSALLQPLQASGAAPGGGTIESIGQPPTGAAYQQPSHPQQISWNAAAF